MRKFRDSVAKRCGYISYSHLVSAKIPNRNIRKRLYRLKDKALSGCKTFHLQYLYRCRRGYVWKDVSRIFFLLAFPCISCCLGGFWRTCRTNTRFCTWTPPFEHRIPLFEMQDNRYSCLFRLCPRKRWLVLYLSFWQIHCKYGSELLYFDRPNSEIWTERKWFRFPFYPWEDLFFWQTTYLKTVEW